MPEPHPDFDPEELPPWEESQRAVRLAGCLATYRRWLEMPDDDMVIATLGAVGANLTPGDPLWLLLVGAPGSGKTEVITPLDALDYVHATATLTEAALLSGTPDKQKAKDARGGLLRHIGDFGIILAKPSRRCCR